MEQLNARVIASYVIMLTSLLVGMAAGMDQKMKDHSLKVHNDYRKNEGASNMAQLTWDSGLEAEAQAWANRCVFEHKGMGENLAWDSNIKNAEDKLIDSSMKRFYDEKLRYSYGQNSCGTSSACHYTQLVWAKTTKVGCATKICNPLGKSGWGKESWFLVCRYEPNGNWNGEKPFEKGQCTDSLCGGGKCQDGLCVGGSGGGSSTGSGGGASCDDKNPQCADWASKGECNKNPAYMNVSCKKSCKKC